MIKEENCLVYQSHTDAERKALIIFYKLCYFGPAIISIIIFWDNSFRNDLVIWSIPLFLLILIIAFGIFLKRFAYKVVFKSNRDIEFRILSNDQIIYAKPTELLNIDVNVYVSFYLRDRKIYFNGGRDSAFVDFLKSNYGATIGAFSIILYKMGFKDNLKNQPPK
jgi:hypothetical protein